MCTPRRRRGTARRFCVSIQAEGSPRAAAECPARKQKRRCGTAPLTKPKGQAHPVAERRGLAQCEWLIVLSSGGRLLSTPLRSPGRGGGARGARHPTRRDRLDVSRELKEREVRLVFAGVPDPLHAKVDRA